MKTLLEILKLSTDYLQQHGISTPRRQAEDLLCDALGIKRMQLYLDFERPLTDSELKECRERLIRRGRGEPLQYIHGKVEFSGCTIAINPSVLIPRQETEILVDIIAKDLSQLPLEGKVLLDLCCGSGYIGIALKKRFPSLDVYLSDISAEALQVTKENAKNNEVQVNILQGDLLEPFHKKAHYVVCNPPYISENEYAALDPEVRNFEPRTALVAGKTGLEFYQRLAKDLPNALHPGGKAWFEIGAGQGEQIKSLFSDPIWKTSAFAKDWAGHDRFFFLQLA